MDREIFMAIGLSKKESDDLVKSTRELAKALSEWNKTSITQEMNKFDGSLTTGSFNGLDKFGIYPDK